MIALRNIKILVACEGCRTSLTKKIVCNIPSYCIVIFTSVLCTCQRDKDHSLVVDSLSAINYFLVSEPLDSFCKIDVYECL